MALPLLKAAYTVAAHSPVVVAPYSEALYLAGRDAEVRVLESRRVLGLGAVVE